MTIVNPKESLRQRTLKGSREDEDGNITASQLTQAAEIHILEAVSIITAPRGLLALVPIDEEKPMLEQISPSVAGLFRDGDSSEGEDRLDEDAREQLRRHRQEQIATQQHLFSALIEQLDKLLNFSLQGGGTYNEDVNECLAHKISCLAALAKCNSGNMQQERLAYMQPAALSVVRVCNQVPQAAIIRAKTVMFLHRMVHSLGPVVIELLGVTYPSLLHNSDANDADQVVQVLNQVMAEFQAVVLPLVDEAMQPTLEKIQNLLADFERAQQESKWVAEQSSSATLASLGLPPTPTNDIKEAPHVDLERVSLQKQYCEFIRHISVHGCHDAFMSTKNRQSLEHVLLQLLKALGGSGAGLDLGEKERIAGDNVFTFMTSSTQISNSEPPRVSQAAGYTLRRIGLNAIIGLTKVWIPKTRGGPAHADGNPANGANTLQIDPAAAAGMANAYRGYLFDHVLPLCLGGYSSGIVASDGSPTNGNENRSPQHCSGNEPLRARDGVRLDLSDAQALGVVGDVGMLLLALAQVTSKEDVATYMQQALPRLGWSNQATHEVVQALIEHTNANQFKDAFKKIFRVWHR